MPKLSVILHRTFFETDTPVAYVCKVGALASLDISRHKVRVDDRGVV